jgi:hypothetical protein
MELQSRKRRVFSTFATCAALATACELGGNVQGLAGALGDPELKNVESPGNLVVEGEFRYLNFDGNTTDGPYVVSITQGGTLSVVHFPDGEGCNAGPVDRFAESVVEDKSALNARIPMIVPATDDTPATLQFVNFACKVDKLRVADAGLPLPKFADAPGVIVQTAAGELLLADPWRNKRTVIATDAAVIRRNYRAMFAGGADNVPWMWTVEGGALVARDTELKEAFRAGKDIQSVEYASFDSTGPMLALTDGSSGLFTVLASDPKSLDKVANDACGALFNEGLNGAELLYFSPCSSRSLHVAELETGKVRDIRAGITDYKVVGATDTGPVFLYVVGAESEGASPTFWARWGQNEPILLGSNGYIDLSRVNSKGEAKVVVDWDGKGGTLLVGELGRPLRRSAESVAYISSAGVLANFDGENGTLKRFAEDDTLEFVAERVSKRGIHNDKQRDRALFLMEFADESGRLVLIEGDDIRTLSKRVRPGDYQFTMQEERVSLISDVDTETQTGTLKLPSTEYDEEGIINEGVSEFVEVDWPSKGMLYSAPQAKRPGIYFARFY